MNGDVSSAKRAAREMARTARCAIDPAVCAGLAEQAAERLLSLEPLATARVVLAYAASPEELDPAPALARLRQRGVRIALPRIESKTELSLRLSESDELLEAGPFGIRQPRADAGIVAHDDIDVVIVPGVAFDHECCRLGYGGGYYDRLLPLLRPTALFVGYAYDEQMIEQLPRSPHDVSVHAVVTPTRVIERPRP